MKIYGYETWAIFDQRHQAEGYFEALKLHPGMRAIRLSDLRTERVLDSWIDQEWDRM